MRLEGIVADVIQAPELEPQIMRYECGRSAGASELLLWAVKRISHAYGMAAFACTLALPEATRVGALSALGCRSKSYR